MSITKSCKLGITLALSLFISASFINPSYANAAEAEIFGSSDGEDLTVSNNVKGDNLFSFASNSGGSARVKVKTKAKNTKKGVKILSQAEAHGATDGDFNAGTYAAGISYLAGTLTYSGPDVGSYIVNVGASGLLHCEHHLDEGQSGPPPGEANASMLLDLNIDGNSILSGFGIQDVSSGFSGSGNVGSGFSTNGSTSTLKKSFPVNLGPLVDGQKLLYLSTLSAIVRYPLDLPLTCDADFMGKKTKSTIKKAKKDNDGKKQPGDLEVDETPPTDVQPVVIDDDGDRLNNSGTEQVLIEADSSVLSSIDDSTAIAVFPGDQSIDLTVSAIGDVNTNGTDDVLLSGTGLLDAIADADNDTMFIFAGTGTGSVLGVIDLNTLNATSP